MSAADPHTDDLADRLDEYADDIDGIDSLGGQTAGDADDLRAAAAELRRLRHRDAALTRLLDAVGDTLTQAESVSGECGELVARPCGPLATAFAAAVEDIDQEHER